MWIVKLALRRTYTFVVVALLIVVLAIAIYAVVALVHPVLARRRPPVDPHPDIPDDVALAPATGRATAQEECTP